MNTHTILRQSLSLLIAGFLLLAASPNRCFAQNDPLLQIRMDVVYLASDDLQGRETGTLGEALAADYIRHRMEQIGLTPKGNNGWYQSFDFSSNPHGGNIRDKQGKNVLGFLNRKAKKTLVIGAHYDHLGHGATGSLAPNDHSIHNGADDNASGIASLLWLAEQLKNTKDLDINVLFVAFSGEEFGLYGSKAFTANWTIPQESILAMFNMDMVGRLNAEKTI
ncbi:MAG TPA: M28 family peptidase, partial [Saprospiraceae bacterium]|nr:M28 family peptidase [Saprospiraceae bacterium]